LGITRGRLEYALTLSSKGYLRAGKHDIILKSINSKAGKK
jgi:hypothetical protein